MSTIRGESPFDNPHPRGDKAPQRSARAVTHPPSIGKSHQTSTRYRDLYDAGQIINQLPIDPDALDRALVIQQQRRNTTLPEDLPDPEPEWAESYNKAATARMAGAQPPFTDYETAVTTVRTQISPPLGRVAGQEARHSITQIETNTPRAPHPNHDRREADPTRYRAHHS